MRIYCALLILVLAPAICRAEQAVTAPSFSFTQVDLDLLERSHQLDDQLKQRGLVYENEGVTRYLTGVGRSVLPAGPEPENVHWQFLVLRDPIPNAFALPDGSIYVNSGLLALIENEAQLASVLAHEETHVLARHGYLENRSLRKKTEAGMIVAGATSIGAAAGGIGPAGLAAELSMPSIVAASVNGYSRELEQTADERAVQAIANAGYSPQEMKRLFDTLQQPRDVDFSKKSFYQDHPKLQERSEYIGKLAESLGPAAAGSTVNSDRYTIATEEALRQDAELEISTGRARTAVWVMERIVKTDDKSAENFCALGDAYSGLGARAPEPRPEELTGKGKGKTRRMMASMTPQEYEEALLKAPGGQQALELNRNAAERNYWRALDISSNFALPHRGLGFLYEQSTNSIKACMSSGLIWTCSRRRWMRPKSAAG